MDGTNINGKELFGKFFAKNLIDLQNCSNSLFVHIGQGIDDNLLYLMRIRWKSINQFSLQC